MYTITGVPHTHIGWSLFVAATVPVPALLNHGTQGSEVCIPFPAHSEVRGENLGRKQVPAPLGVFNQPLLYHACHLAPSLGQMI